VGRNVTATEATAAAGMAATTGVAAATTALGKCRLRKTNREYYDECSKKLMHCSSASHNGKDSAAEDAFEPAVAPGRLAAMRTLGCRQCV
jgi:hypothetical protein